MQKIVILSRSVYWRQMAVACLLGFLSYRLLVKDFVRPQVLESVVPVLVFSVFVLAWVAMRAG
jgi:hypothetical protein